MKALLIQSGDYRLTATVRNLDRPQGHVSLQMHSTLATAKDPSAEHKVLDLTLDQSAVVRLAGILSSAVAV